MRTIPIGINNEYVSGSGVVVGSAGSAKEVKFRITFNDTWASYNKQINWVDSHGTNATLTVLTDDHKVSEGVYDVTVPAGPKTYEGNMMVTFKGYTIVDNVIGELAVTTTAYFKVLPSEWQLDQDESLDPTTAQQLQAAITSHTSNTSNPHSVTKAQVGLGNVDNTSDTNKPISTATQAALDTKMSLADTVALINVHANATNNPHNVTKAQVGLGNVDNTSDLSKPISTATYNALLVKYEKPASGIPENDLRQSVQTSLEKADTAYQKPNNGIPSTDMTYTVQTSLGKAETAYQKPANGIPKTDLASAVQTSLGKADTAVQDVSGKMDATDAVAYNSISLGRLPGASSDTGYNSFAQGNFTKASGMFSTAIGGSTLASASKAFANGDSTIAGAEGSHAEGWGTKASSSYQHAEGKYNIEDLSNKYAHIVGNGTNSTRANAETLSWNGVLWAASDVRCGGADQDAASHSLSGKVNEPASEGTSGQVLATDGNGTRYWKTVSGGGGTSDYADLVNKPKINSVELIGNKSLSDLGVAAASHTHTKSQITDLTLPTKISDLTDDTSSNPIDKADTLTGLTATVNELNIMDGVTASASEINVLDGITASTTELNYVDGVTSAIQTQINGKANSSHTHSASDITSGTLADARIASASTWNAKASKPTKTTVSIDNNWTGSASPYTHSVSGITVTSNSKVDIQTDSTAIAQMVTDSVTAIYIENNNGTLTAYAIGNKPTATLSMQVTVTEVSV